MSEQNREDEGFVFGRSRVVLTKAEAVLISVPATQLIPQPQSVAFAS